MVVHMKSNLSKEKYFMILFTLLMIQQIAIARNGSHNTLRLRGGMTDREKLQFISNDKNFNEIPYLTNIRFLWNGLPTIDFIIKIMYPINNGLGSITVGSDTLLTTALNRDKGMGCENFGSKSLYAICNAAFCNYNRCR